MSDKQPMEFTQVGSVDGSPIFKRGDWYFARNSEGKWCKLLWDWDSGKRLVYVLEKDFAQLKAQEVTPIGKKGETFFIEPL